MKNGFTLLELMVVVLLTSVVMAALFMVLSSGQSTWFEADTQVTVQQELRKALRAMKRDLAMSGAGASKINVSADGSSVQFHISQGATADGVVNWSSTPINFSVASGQLLRTEGASTAVLANNVGPLSFTRDSSRMLNITITVSKTTKANRNISVTHEESIYLRN